MFGPEDHAPGPDFQDGWRLERCGDGEQGEPRQAAGLAAGLLMRLSVEELETPLDIQRLRRKADRTG